MLPGCERVFQRSMSRNLLDNADEAFASNDRAAKWVRNNVLEFTRIGRIQADAEGLRGW
jgi:hypothetical protein